MPPVPGALITPNVRLVRLLGQGGMGSVWVGDHLTLRTQVAVKFISDEYTKDADALERFSREATAVAQIKSPHVVQVFDHGVYVTLPYIVMELLEGEDLAARIERGPLPLGEMGAVLQQIGRALTQAHAVGVVHRDIKPANVFLTSAGGELHVKVLDFGIAKVNRPGADPSYRMTQTGQLIGTPCYMSPEQIFSRGDIDLRVDLWALAVLVYEGVTGELPFNGKTLGDMYLAINSAAYTVPTKVDRAFPRALDAWFERAFAKDAQARFGSAKEMVEAFLPLAAKHSGTQRRPRPPTPIPTAALARTEPAGGDHPTQLSPGVRRAGGAPRGVIAGAAAGALAVGMVAALLVFRERSPAPVAALTPSVSADPSTSVGGATSGAAPDVSPAPEASGTAAPEESSAVPTAPRPTAPLSTSRPSPSSTSGPATKKRRPHGF